MGDLCSIPGLGRSPGEGKGYPLPYSFLDNSMDCVVHRVTESDMTNFQVNTGSSVEMILEGIRDPSESYCNYPGKKEMMVCEPGHLC